MKAILSIFLVCAAVWQPVQNPLTQAERDLAVSELTQSLNHLLGTVEGLTESQRNFKSETAGWSVAECLEHILITEITLTEALKKRLQEPTDAAKRAEIKISDEVLLAQIKDRYQRVKTQEPFEPSGKFGTVDDMLAEFDAKRSKNIKFVKQT